MRKFLLLLVGLLVTVACQKDVDDVDFAQAEQEVEYIAPEEAIETNSLSGKSSEWTSTHQSVFDIVSSGETKWHYGWRLVNDTRGQANGGHAFRVYNEDNREVYTSYYHSGNMQAKFINAFDAWYTDRVVTYLDNDTQRSIYNRIVAGETVWHYGWRLYYKHFPVTGVEGAEDLVGDHIFEIELGVPGPIRGYFFWVGDDAERQATQFKKAFNFWYTSRING